MYLGGRDKLDQNYRLTTVNLNLNPDLDPIQNLNLNLNLGAELTSAPNEGKQTKREQKLRQI